MPKPEAATNVLQEVDNNFIGFNSRLDPSNLQPGYAQASRNVRLQRGTAQPRKGTKRLTDDTLLSEIMVGSGVFVDKNGDDNIVLIFKDFLYFYNTSTAATAEYFFPAGRIIEVDDVAEVTQALGRLYVWRGEETNPRIGTGITSETAGLSLDIPEVQVGETKTITATTVNGNVLTGYANGDEITIFNINTTGAKSVNNSYIIGSASSSGFTFSFKNTTSATIPAQTVSSCCVKVKPPLIWDSETNLVTLAKQSSILGNSQTTEGVDDAGTGSVPPADFGFYFQNRLVCKVSRTEIVVSDILSDVFDFTLNNFIINQGGNDTIVGVLPWIENQFVVFMQKSIYVAYLDPRFDPTAPDQSQVTVVTTQVGCLSRKSIASAGQFIFFMSGKGVNMLTPALDLKLIGNTLPLSEPIDDFFDSVNFNAAGKTVSSYYDNRFFMALPINESARPNAIIVYNTLNQAWETIDTYPDGLYIDNYAVCQYQQKRRLFILTRFTGTSSYGGIFLTEESEGGDEFSPLFGNPVLDFVLPAKLTPDTLQTIPIDARIRSRQYTFDNVNEKRFSRAEYQFNNIAGDFIKILIKTHDPDIADFIMEYEFTGSTAADSTLRPRIGLRGACMDSEVQFITGRPALKTAVIYAIVANRNMISEE